MSAPVFLIGYHRTGPTHKSSPVPQADRRLVMAEFSGAGVPGFGDEALPIAPPCAFPWRAHMRSASLCVPTCTPIGRRALRSSAGPPDVVGAGLFDRRAFRGAGENRAGACQWSASRSPLVHRLVFKGPSQVSHCFWPTPSSFVVRRPCCDALHPDRTLGHRPPSARRTTAVIHPIPPGPRSRLRISHWLPARAATKVPAATSAPRFVFKNWRRLDFHDSSLHRPPVRQLTATQTYAAPAAVHHCRAAVQPRLPMEFSNPCSPSSSFRDRLHARNCSRRAQPRGSGAAVASD